MKDDDRAGCLRADTIYLVPHGGGLEVQSDERVIPVSL